MRAGRSPIVSAPWRRRRHSAFTACDTRYRRRSYEKGSGGRRRRRRAQSNDDNNSNNNIPSSTH